MIWDQSFIQLFQKGGFAMWPLLLCSIIGTAIIVERAYYFARLRFDYQKFVGELKRLLTRIEIPAARDFASRQSHPVGKMAELYLANLDEDSLRDGILKREGSFALEKVERRLNGLAAITHIAPLLGLLGTVTGLVSAFHQIERLGGSVQPGDLASGIWEALITTVFGLLIALPCMAAYHSFTSQADRIARRMQFLISELDEFFGKHFSGSFKSQSAELTEETMKVVQ